MSNNTQLKRIITVPLPPSVNTIYMWNPRTHTKIYTQNARNYLEINSIELKSWKNKNNVKVIDDYKHVNFEFFLSRKNCDSHNYFKLLCDVLERAGIVSNDKYLMTQIEKVEFDSKNPRVIISWNEN